MYIYFYQNITKKVPAVDISFVVFFCTNEKEEKKIRFHNYCCIKYISIEQKKERAREDIA